MRVALDAMGGDHAPGPMVAGAFDALAANPDLHVSLVGDPAQLDELLRDQEACDRLEVVPSEGVVDMDEKPTDALRKKPKASIVVCWRLMASRNVDAIISAGNTGGVVAAGLRTRLFLKGVKRPGIAVPLPTLRGTAVLMDVGANPLARPEHLVQYGVMGRLYAQNVLGVESPRVGLMNIGSEDGKGNDLYRDTHKLLADSALREHYVGNVEGRGLYQGEADVLICEGFVGNVVLKVSEGMAGFMIRSVASQLLPQLESEREAATAAFRGIEKQFLYSATGGAPLLGIDGICVICHGSSDARSICNAFNVAGALHDREMNAQIIAGIDHLRSAGQESESSA